MTNYPTAKEDNKCLLDGTDDAVAGLREELEEWQSLHAMTSALLHAANLDAQLSLILGTVIGFFGADAGTIALYDKAHNRFCTVARKGIAGAAFDPAIAPDRATALFDQAYSTRQRVIDGGTSDHMAILCVTPILGADGSALGVLAVRSPGLGHPSPRQLHLTDVCIAHAALLIERCKVEADLFAEQERSGQILESISDGFLVMDQEFRVVQINAEAVRIDGRPREQLLGRTHWEIWPGSEERELGTYYKDAMRTRIPVHFEQRYPHQGQDRWFQISAYPYADGLALLYADATERKRDEQALQDSEKKFLQLANAIPQLAWIADASGHIGWYNQRWYDYTGTRFEEMAGWGWQSVHHPDTLDEVVVRWTHSINTGESFQMSFPLKGHDGVYRPFFTLVSPLRDAQGRILQWFGTNTDVSALREAQQAIEKSQSRLNDGLAAGRMVVWDWFLDSDRFESSSNARELFGHDWSDVKSVWACIHAEDVVRLRAAALKAVEDCGNFHETVRMLKPGNTQPMWVEMRGRVQCDEHGSARQASGILLDITERQLAQEQLTEANARKDEFLAMLAHELRNPLSPISSAAHLLTVADISPERVRKSSQVIIRQVGFMTDLIDDLLDVSRVTRGLVVIDREVLRVTDIINGAIEQVRPLMDSRRQQLTVELDPNVPTLCGDRTRLVQVIANLINNSAKYTPHEGKICVSVRAEGDIKIRVVDNGMGIGADLLPYVFDLFAQGARTPDRAQGGLGLGLALVKSIVHLHGGTVSASSEGAGKGSTVEISLPPFLDHGEVDPVEQLTSACASSLRIAIVDDNMDAATALASLLEAQGHSTFVTHDAFTLLGEPGRCHNTDVFILDIGLPGMDGYELVRELRKFPSTAHARMIALTGYGQSHDKAIGKAAGFDDYFVKPMDIAQLTLILSTVRPRARQ